MMRLVCGGESREVHVSHASKALQVNVGGTTFFPEVTSLGGGTFLARVHGRSHVFHCVREGDVIHLFWQGAVYRLEVESAKARAAQRHAAGGLEAPMPGKVIAVKVIPGQSVTKGQELLVVESMKMENAIRAPKEGTVKSVTAQVGEMVSPGNVLVEIE